VLAALPEARGNVTPLPCDVADRAAVSAMVADAERHCGPVGPGLSQHVGRSCKAVRGSGHPAAGWTAERGGRLQLDVLVLNAGLGAALAPQSRASPPPCTPYNVCAGGVGGGGAAPGCRAPGRAFLEDSARRARRGTIFLPDLPSRQPHPISPSPLCLLPLPLPSPLIPPSDPLGFQN
jgi:NAD(P)-dependent dehydrogenase (short-subunit alcohol dehydrogenase family)